MVLTRHGWGAFSARIAAGIHTGIVVGGADMREVTHLSVSQSPSIAITLAQMQASFYRAALVAGPAIAEGVGATVAPFPPEAAFNIGQPSLDLSALGWRVLYDVDCNLASGGVCVDFAVPLIVTPSEVVCLVTGPAEDMSAPAFVSTHARLVLHGRSIVSRKNAAALDLNLR